VLIGSAWATAVATREICKHRTGSSKFAGSAGGAYTAKVRGPQCPFDSLFKHDIMQQYHDLMACVLERGQYKPNRTGIGTIADVGYTVKYDLREGFPAVTTKKLFFDAVKGELLGFFRGYTNAADFRKLGCRIWDQNANETPAWVNNPHRKGTDDLGRIYGAQWTAWRDTRIVYRDEEAKKLEAAGFECKAFDPTRGAWVFERTINQLEEALRMLLTDPFNRRIAVSGWRPDEFDRMALAPCHSHYHWSLMPDRVLHSTLLIRSNDLFLGHAFNAASLALFTHIMARLAGVEAGTATIFIADAHIYENHVEQVKEQLSRSHYPPPKLVLSDRIRKVETLDEIKGVFERIEPEDIRLEGYQCHPAIKAPMAA